MISSILFTDSFLELAAGFGYVHNSLPLKQQLQSLKKLSNEVWDFRKGKERSQVVPTQLHPSVVAAVYRAAESLGMLHSTQPVYEAYDYVSVLGGASKKPLERIGYTKQLIDQGLSVKALFLLGSSRKVWDSEREVVEAYAPGAVDEFEMMNGALESIYGDDIESSDSFVMFPPNTSMTSKDYWRVKVYFLRSGLSAISLSSPIRDGRERANTGDTYAFLNDVLAEDAQSASFLNVTSAITAPYQGIDAKRLIGLKSAAYVETIGCGVEITETTYRPDEYLQEINSLINQAWLLLESSESSLSVAA